MPTALLGKTIGWTFCQESPLTAHAEEDHMAAKTCFNLAEASRQSHQLLLPAVVILRAVAVGANYLAWSALLLNILSCMPFEARYM